MGAGWAADWKMQPGEYIPFFRCRTEHVDLLLIRTVGIQAGAELEIGPIVRTQLAAVRGTVRTFASGDHMVNGVLNMAQVTFH